MNLYLISQNKNDDYDTYSDAVVAAEDETLARFTHPGGSNWVLIPKDSDDFDLNRSGVWLQEGMKIEDVLGFSWSDSEWVEPDFVDVKLIGFATGEIKAGVICASYHAG